MTEPSWFDKHFSTCEHGLVRGYCIACTTADREQKDREEALERENAELRRLLHLRGVSR